MHRRFGYRYSHNRVQAVTADWKWDSDTCSPGVCDNEASWSVQPVPANPAGIQTAVRAPLADLKAN